MSNVEILFDLVQLLIIVLVIILSSYLRKKGENLATKEDIGELTKQVESIKSELNLRLHMNQTRYLKEYDLLEQLAEKLEEIYHLSMSVDHEKNKKQLDVTPIKVVMDFKRFVKKKSPFLPESIQTALSQLIDGGIMFELLSFKNGNYIVKGEFSSKESREYIERKTKYILDMIGEYIQKWDVVN